MTRSAPATLPRWARALDLATGLLLVLSLLVSACGGFREYFFGVRVSLTSWWRLALAALAVAALRHLIVRTDPFPARIARLVRRVGRSNAIRAAAGPVLGTRPAVLIVGYFAAVMIGFGPGGALFRVSDNELLNLPARWDAGWYLSIVEHGYFWNRDPRIQQNVVFFPALPVLMYVAGLFTNRQWLVAGTLLSIAAFFWALTYLFRLARARLGDDEARAALWFIAAYPFAVYFGAAYTESLYLLGVVAACFHFERGQPWRAAVWGMLVGLCRPNGFFLSVPLGLLWLGRLVPGALNGWLGRGIMPSRGAPQAEKLTDAPPMALDSVGAEAPTLHRSRSSPIRGREWSAAAMAAAVVAPMIGAAIYSAYLYFEFRDPLVWTRGQVGWGRVYEGVWTGLESLVVDRQSFLATHGLYAYSIAQPMDLLNSVAALFAIVALVPVTRRFGPAYGAFVAISVFPPLLAGGTLSMGRMTSVLFPIFLWLGSAVAPRRRTAWLAAFAIFQGLIAALFYSWRPAI